MSFQKKLPREHQHSEKEKVLSASSTFIDARLSYDKRGRLVRMDMGNDRFYVFTYPDRATVKVRYVQHPTFQHRLTEEAQTITRIDRSGRITSSRFRSSRDTMSRYFSYDSLGKIRFELSVQKGAVPTMTRIGNKDTSYLEPYSYTDSAVYSWKDGNLEAKRVYRNGRSMSEAIFYYDNRYGGHQHAPYNSGYSMLVSVTEISGMTCYQPYLSKSLKSKEVLIRYGLERDTLSSTITVYSSLVVDTAGRLTAYEVRESEDHKGQNRGSSFDRFTINYAGNRATKIMKADR